MTTSNPEIPDMQNEITSEVRAGALWVTFNRPEARNALTFGMYEELARLCASVPTDGSIHAIVVTGAGGKAFAAGTDMTQFRAFETDQDALDYEEKINRVLTTVETCPLPTIAAVHGACTGGGAAIAAACDIRIASAQLKFGFPIARTLGNCLSAGNLARLSELMGAGRVREMIFTARLLGADEAQAIGLVSEVLPDEAALTQRAEAMAQHLAGMAPLTLRATKEAMRRNRAALAAQDDDLITMCYMSEDFKHGLEAFLAKEKPTWSGK
jgi:enoyl-CoA hydratase/carnithine racemase